jgi:SAM-dependent methyltransferase
MNIYRKLIAAFWRISMLGLSRGSHITRYSMYHSLSIVGKSLSRKDGDVLSISHSSFLCDLLEIEPNTFTEVNYPDGNLLNLAYPDNSFDFVVSDQVLEHVQGDPQQAFNESWRVLRPGGIVVHTTCFINPIHNVPGDYWRFTPDALKLLSNKFSKIISCDGWGNFGAWLLIRNGLRFDGIPHAKWHPLHQLAIKNDPLWPIVTWVIAEK